MKSFTILKNLAGSLSQNTSTANLTLMGQLISDQHRYLIEKYFDNERTFAVDIIGAQDITLASSLSSGATSATLDTAWGYQTCKQFVNFSNGDQRMCQFTNGSTAITWDAGLSDSATTSVSTVGVRDYPIPANISKIKNATLTIGQLAYQMKPVQTRQEWDYINTLPYTSDIPLYFFIYNGTLGIWPIPVTANNVLTFNYKTRVPDLSFTDYTTGNITAMTAGSYNVTGTSTNWSSSGGYPTGVDITYLNLYLRVDPPYGDGIWYPIQSFTSDTALTLALPVVNAPNITASSTYTIGQMPLLYEDFHDMLVYGALMIYSSTIQVDRTKYEQFEKEYNKRLVMLEDYLGTKQFNIDLEDEPTQQNPNLYPYQLNT